MSHATIDLQLACDATDLPDATDITRWVETATAALDRDVELTIRVVDEEESRTLNHTYRGKDRPTNVLSFPFEVPDGIDLNLLGDLVICAPVVTAEADSQGKPLRNHWAHMVIHGTLHLLGYDHIEDADAQAMETLEIQLLDQLGIPTPYETH